MVFFHVPSKWVVEREKKEGGRGLVIFGLWRRRIHPATCVLFSCSASFTCVFFLLFTWGGGTPADLVEMRVDRACSSRDASRTLCPRFRGEVGGGGMKKGSITICEGQFDAGVPLAVPVVATLDRWEWRSSSFFFLLGHRGRYVVFGVWEVGGGGGGVSSVSGVGTMGLQCEG